MDKEEKTRETVRLKFTEYLTANKCRKTPERYAILDLIYSKQGHFNIDSFYEAMNEQNFRVSRATIYNTIQLLLDCNLVHKHQFGQNVSFYERAYNNESHHHLICADCNKVQEYKDAELKTFIQNKKIKQFTPTNYSLNFYGLCNKCIRKKEKEKNRMNNIISTNK
ncbi:MAG: transcriptional repressor [Dysgonamonadaceae bacterium]|jgi:Fur family ferric uptake transcriptional regulator|nr:transcriptional repressor [Dysgonamonadaceae bacterium]